MKSVSDEAFFNAYGAIGTPEKLLTEEQKNNRSIIYKVINKYRRYFEFDELVSFGLVGMWRALASHIDGKGNKFTTSLWRFVDWECKRQYRNKTKRKKVIHTVSIDNLEVEDKIIDGDLFYLHEKLSELPDLDKQILTEYYLEGYTMQEIGDKNGYSKEAARQKIKKALVKLNEKCGVK